MWIRSLMLTAALAACSSSSSSPTTSTTSPTPVTGADTGAGSAAGSATEGSAATTPPEGPGIGETCGTGDACAAGLTCISYYGIAGAKGPQFKTCEIRCDDATPCPKDRRCATIADGPGRVCR